MADLADYDVPILSAPNDGRPVSFGIRTIADLHTARQLAYLTAARRWLSDAQLDPRVARALSLAVSSTITSNNRLCGYATDYGRLAPLFSIRAFSLPWLAVELNPLNPTGGRGTLAAALAAWCARAKTRLAGTSWTLADEQFLLPSPGPVGTTVTRCIAPMPPLHSRTSVALAGSSLICA